jgi:hypothetical protein
MYSLTIEIKNLSGGQHWSILIFDASTTKKDLYYMKERIFRNMARFLFLWSGFTHI